MLKIKVCGMRDAANIAEVASHQPNYMGFIFYQRSSRYVGPHWAMPQLPEHIVRTGVFVDEAPQAMQAAVQAHGLGAVQLHGEELPEVCQQLRQQSPVQVIKAFSLDDTFNFALTYAYEAFCDFFLFDTKGKLPGGNGSTFNWSILDDYKGQLPFFLSGGIGLEHIEAIAALKHPLLYGIDVNSRFETAPAQKDSAAIGRFIHLLRN